jgi:hypothetical protein
MRQPLSFLTFLWTSLVLLLVGLGGLAVVIIFTEPFPTTRWLFFFLLTLAVSGLALPVTYFLNRRFPSNPPVEPAVVVREAIWAGIYVDVLAWLKMGGVLTTGIALALAAGLGLVEFLLRLGERSTWSPSQEPLADAAGAEDEDDEDEEDD